MDLKMSEVFEAPPIYERLRVGQPFPHVGDETLAPLPRVRSFISGYPVRKEFLVPPENYAAELSDLRQELRGAGGEEPDVRLLIMTGGGGQDVPWPKLLAKKGWK